MSEININPPDKDEVEVSLFGPGIGECVVTHLGNNRWAVVDSCIDRNNGRPVALNYLEQMGLKPDEIIKFFSITHWHDDHIRGASQIIQQCPELEFFMPAALLREEFSKFIDVYHRISRVTESGVDEFATTTDILRSRHLDRGRGSSGIHFASENKILYKDLNTDSFSPISIMALSPSDEASVLALTQFSELIAKDQEPKKRAIPLKPNQTSIALWIIVGPYTILLGGDVEVGTDDNIGWRAIVKNTFWRPRQAILVKIPHHGSSSAFHQPMWTQMVASSPISIVAPFARGRKPLPSNPDIHILKNHSIDIFCTAQPKGFKPPRGNRMADKFIDGIAISRRSIESKMGHVQVRFKDGTPPKIGLNRAAFKL